MMQHPDWACHTVQDFFEHCNWLGMVQSVSSAPVSVPLVDHWQRQTVAAFFLNHNWSGQSQRPQETPTLPPAALTNTVGHYLGMLPWDGHPRIGHLPQVESTAPTARTPDNFSLADLSNLF